MARLIDAEALVKALLDRSFYPTAVRRAIEKAPTIDAEPVVRCKDCRYAGLTECLLCYIEQQTLCFVNHDPEFYCKKGERKDNERKAD